VSEVALFPFGLIASAASPNWVVAIIFIIGFFAAYLAVRALVPLVVAENP
jgi:hypothetical protein